jgi:hypothetical protein
MTTPTTSNGLYQTSNSSNSTLRPRNTRLISYLGEDVDSSNATAIATSTSSSKIQPLFPERETSPVSKRTRNRDVQGSSKGSPSTSRKTSTETSRPTNNDIWSSWSSIASSLLGSDTTSAGKSRARGTNTTPRWMKQDTLNGASSVSKWGPKPKGLDAVVPGSQEDRLALLQAKRREALLLGSAEENKDASGRYKRRDSDANMGQAPIDEHEEDALVYVHKIRREDTLPGVMLKYGCQQDVFRKVNRFWPNDNIQVRKHVFLPVEACTVRGKKVDGPQSGPDLLDAAMEDLHKATTPGKGGLKRMGMHESADGGGASTSQPSPSYVDNPDLKHDSWVALPNFEEPVAILRIPRSSLGYFPRARRKSVSKSLGRYSDSITSTPRSSFDNLRHPPSHAAQMSLAQSQSLSASPVRKPDLISRQSSTRSRASSTAQPVWTEVLRGPGGVGNLRGLRTEPSRPGPADDPLNKKFAQYFPELAITGQEPTRDLAPPSLLLGITTQRRTPRASMDSTRSARSNSSSLADLTGGVEGWMRKIAGNKTGREKRLGVSAGAGAMNDLIELETTSDSGLIGGGPAADQTSSSTTLEEEDDDDLRTPTVAAMVGSGIAKLPVEDAQRSDEALLNERFPIRGRIQHAYEDK